MLRNLSLLLTTPPFYIYNDLLINMAKLHTIPEFTKTL